MEEIGSKLDIALQSIPKTEIIPTWAKVLITTMRDIATEFGKINEVVANSLKLNDKIQVQNAVSTALAKDNDALRKRLSQLEQLIDDNEQHGRNRNLVLKGVPEQVNQRNGNYEKTTELFVNSINQNTTVKVDKKDIERSHRLGRFQPGKNRPIIARFKDETQKIFLYRNKKQFKGKGQSIAENLTKRRQSIYNAACDKLNYKNVWTIEGRIYAKHGEQKISISSMGDIPGIDPNIVHPPTHVSQYLDLDELTEV